MLMKVHIKSTLEKQNLWTWYYFRVFWFTSKHLFCSTYYVQVHWSLLVRYFNVITNTKYHYVHSSCLVTLIVLQSINNSFVCTAFHARTIPMKMCRRCMQRSPIKALRAIRIFNSTAKAWHRAKDKGKEHWKRNLKSWYMQNKQNYLQVLSLYIWKFNHYWLISLNVNNVIPTTK